MKHIVQQWQAEFDWVKSVREQELKAGAENAHDSNMIRRDELAASVPERGEPNWSSVSLGAILSF